MRIVRGRYARSAGNGAGAIRGVAGELICRNFTNEEEGGAGTASFSSLVVDKDGESARADAGQQVPSLLLNEVGGMMSKFKPPGSHPSSASITCRAVRQLLGGGGASMVTKREGS